MRKMDMPQTQLSDEDIRQTQRLAAQTLEATAALVGEIERLRARVQELEAVAPKDEAYGTVYLKRQIRDWRLESGGLEEADVPRHARAAFDLEVVGSSSGVLVRVASTGPDERHGLVVCIEVSDGQPTVHVQGGAAFGEETAKSFFALPGGQIVARPGDLDVTEVDRSFMPGDAPEVVRVVLANEGFEEEARHFEPGDRRPGRFAPNEKFFKYMPLDGTTAELVLMLEFNQRCVALSAGPLGGIDATSRREHAFNSQGGVGSAVGELLLAIPAVASEVRDHVQKRQFNERI